MALVVFASSIQRHVSVPEHQVDAPTVGAALAAVFSRQARLQTYILDEQGHLRKHVTIFIDGRRVRDPVGLSDPVRPDSEIYVVQALSGG